MMNDDDSERYRAMWDEMTMLHTSVSAIRKAQGKLNPSDCQANTDEYERVVDDYADDLERAMHGAWWTRWIDQQR